MARPQTIADHGPSRPDFGQVKRLTAKPILPPFQPPAHFAVAAWHHRQILMTVPPPDSAASA